MLMRTACSQLLEAESAGGRQVERHDFEGGRFLVQRLRHLVVWLLHQGAESGHAPLLIIRSRPQS